MFGENIPGPRDRCARRHQKATGRNSLRHGEAEGKSNFFCAARRAGRLVAAHDRVMSFSLRGLKPRRKLSARPCGEENPLGVSRSRHSVGARRRGQLKQDLQLLLRRRQNAGGNRDGSRQAGSACEEHRRQTPSRRYPVGIHHAHRLCRRQRRLRSRRGIGKRSRPRLSSHAGASARKRTGTQCSSGTRSRPTSSGTRKPMR